MMRKVYGLIAFLCLFCPKIYAADTLDAWVPFTVDGVSYIAFGYYYLGSYDPTTDSFSAYVINGPAIITNIHEIPSSGNFVLPSSVTYRDKTLDVLAIDEYAFNNCTDLISVHIPSSIDFRERLICYEGIEETIKYGYSPFRGCVNLEKITFDKGHKDYNENNAIIVDGKLIAGCNNTIIPKSVSIIGSSAFFGSGITSIDIPNSVITISDNAFEGCKELKDFTCASLNPPTVGEDAFKDTPVESVVLHVPGISIDRYKGHKIWGKFKEIVAIEGLNYYTLTYMVDEKKYQAFEIKEGDPITALNNPTKEGYTFSGWSEIPETMPDHDVIVTGTFVPNPYKLIYKVDGKEYKVVEVRCDEVITAEPDPVKKGMTFSGWSEIPETMPAKDVEVNGTFSWSKITEDNITYLVTDTINNGCTVISSVITSGAVKIAPTVTFDEDYKVRTINDKIFYGKSGVTSIELPSTITSIGERAFANIDKLTDVTILAGEIPNTDRTAFENSYIEDYVTLYVPEASVDKYKSTAPWKNFKEIVGVSVQNDTDDPNKCATPSVSIANGKMLFACETEGVTYHYKVSCSFEREGEGDNIELDNVYKVTVYASKEGYTDSEVLTKEVSASQLDYDLNGDKKVNASDIVKMVKLMLEGK